MPGLKNKVVDMSSPQLLSHSPKLTLRSPRTTTTKAKNEKTHTILTVKEERKLNC